MISSIASIKMSTTTLSVTGEAIRNLSDKVFVIPSEFKYGVTTVQKDWEARPDLISIALYKDDSYTELLCRLNGISNPFELNEGDKLVYPAPEELYRFYTSDTLKIEEPDIKKDNAKSRAEIRKPSDVTVGDSRYTVDKERKIIIY